MKRISHANKNTIPNDPQSTICDKWCTSWNSCCHDDEACNTEDMDRIAEAIAMLIDDVNANKAKAMEIVKTLTDKYPLY